MKPYYVTQEGLEKLQKEFEFLKNEKMPEIIERIARAKELGDLSENAEYQDAKDEQAFTAGRIVELEDLFRRVEVIQESESKEFVSLGSRIVVTCDGSEKEYMITGSNEADPGKGAISNESPLGKAFLGRKIGEKVTINVPRGEMKCEIVAIK